MFIKRATTIIQTGETAMCYNCSHLCAGCHACGHASPFERDRLLQRKWPDCFSLLSDQNKHKRVACVLGLPRLFGLILYKTYMHTKEIHTLGCSERETKEEENACFLLGLSIHISSSILNSSIDLFVITLIYINEKCT